MAVCDRLEVRIDVGTASHNARAVDATGKVVFARNVLNGHATIGALIPRAGKEATDVGWAVDMVSGAAGLLLATGQVVRYVPGRLVNRMAGEFPGDAKTDAKYARMIAETARPRGDLTSATRPDGVVADLQVLTGRRADLMTDWVRGVSRLRQLRASGFRSLER